MIFASRMRAGLFVLATVAAFSPVQVPFGSRPLAAGAECPTCCDQAGPKCVVCSTTCVSVENAYDSGTGPCPVT